MAVNEAYQVLSKPHAKHMYDMDLIREHQQPKRHMDMDMHEHQRWIKLIDNIR